MLDRQQRLELERMKRKMGDSFPKSLQERLDRNARIRALLLEVDRLDRQGAEG